MRNVWRNQAAVLIVFVLSLAGCDSTQPARVETRTASLSFTTTGIIPLFNCWEQWRDLNADGSIDPADDLNLNQLLCEPAGTAQRKVPWRYSLIITVIRAGTTFENLVFSNDGVLGSSVLPGDGIDDFISMTDYDPGVEQIADKDHEGDLYFVHGKQVSNASPIYLLSQQIDLGPPNILGYPTSFDFDLNTGDTLVVRARKQAHGAVNPPFLPSEPPPELVLQSSLSINGVGVAALGTTASSIADQDGVNFSFTVR